MIIITIRRVIMLNAVTVNEKHYNVINPLVLAGSVGRSTWGGGLSADEVARRTNNMNDRYINCRLKQMFV